MFPGVETLRVFVRPGPTDMRKAINGLAALAQEAMAQNPLDGGLFVFCNARRTVLKILYWDANGFCLWMKRLDLHRFPWPRREAECVTIDCARLKDILRGIDFWNAHTTLTFSRVT
jgi:transposase